MSEKEPKAKDPKTTDDNANDEENDESGKTRKIRVDVTMTKEMKDIQEQLRIAKNELESVTTKSTAEKEQLLGDKEKIETELKEKTAILEQQALDEFEREKKTLLELASKSKLTKEQVDEIEKKLSTPKNLEVVKGIMEMMLSAITSPPEEKEKDKEKKPPAPPSGKATFTVPDGSETFANNVAMIDELYDRAYYHKDKYTPEQVSDAKRKIDTIFQSLISGPSWDAMKKGEKIPLPKIMACPKCGTTIIGELEDKCAKCGFSLGKTGDAMRGRG